MSLKQPLSSITLNMLLVGFSRVIVQCWYLPKDSNHQTYLLCVMHLYRQWHWQQQGHSCKLTDLQGTGSALHSSNGEVFPRCSCSYFCISVSPRHLSGCAGQGDAMAEPKQGPAPPQGCHIPGVSLRLLCLQPWASHGAREELPVCRTVNFMALLPWQEELDGWLQEWLRFATSFHFRYS